MAGHGLRHGADRRGVSGPFVAGSVGRLLAELAVDTGQPLDALLDADEDLLATLADVRSASWTRTEQLLAGIFDSLGMVAHLLEKQYVAQGAANKQAAAAANKLKAPDPLERPGVKKRRRGTTLGEFKRMVGGGDG